MPARRAQNNSGRAFFLPGLHQIERKGKSGLEVWIVKGPDGWPQASACADANGSSKPMKERMEAAQERDCYFVCLAYWTLTA